MTTGRINQVAVRQRRWRPADSSTGPDSNLDTTGANAPTARDVVPLRQQATFPTVSITLDNTRGICARAEETTGERYSVAV